MIISVVACSKKDVSTNENILPLSESAAIISEYTLDNEYFIDPNNVTCMKLIDSYKDGFVFEGINRKFNDNFTVLSMDNDNYGRITERKFSFEESELNIESFVEYNENIVTLSSFESDYYICIFNLDGQELKRKRLDYYPNDIEVKNNKIYVLYPLELSVCCYTMDLDEVNNEKIDNEYNDTIINPLKICVSDDDTVYCLIFEKMNETGMIEKLGKISSTIRSNINDIGNIEDMFLCNSGNFMVSGVKDGKYMIDVIAPDGNIADYFEFENCNKIYGITDSDHIIYSSDSKINDYYNGETKAVLSESDYPDLNIYNVFNNTDTINVYLNSETINHEAVIEVDCNGNITSEYKSDYIVDSCVSGDIIYMINSAERSKYEVNYIQNGRIQKTDIEFDNEIPHLISDYYDGKIIVYSVSSNSDAAYLSVFDKDFKLLNRTETNIFIRNMFLADGKFFITDNEAVYLTDNNCEIIKTDIDIKGLSNDAKYYPGNNEYSFIVSDGDLLAGYILKENLWIKIADVNTLGGKKIDSAVINDNGEIFINCITCIYRIQKNDNMISNPENNTIIKIACFDMYYDNIVADAVQMYNSDCGQKAVEIKRYKDISDNGALNQFDADLVSGDIPDIIVWGRVDIDSYLNKDMFADLNEFIDNDIDYKRSDFNENILDAFMYNGKLMALPLYYYFDTILSAVKGDFNNFDEYMDYVIENVEAQQYFCELGTIDTILKCFLSTRVTDNKIDISESEMQKIIRFFNSYYCLENEEAFNNPVFLRRFEFDNASNFSEIGNYMNPDDLNVGYYNISGLVIPSLYLSVTEKSEKKDEAWSFIKYLCNTRKNILFKKYPSAGDISVMKSNEEKNDLHISQDIQKRYKSLVEGKWINYYYNSNLVQMITAELYYNPDMPVEEKSRLILGKIEKYYYETR